MYDSLISKMVDHFSEIGLIIYSKAKDFTKMQEISIEDIEMYYDILCSEEIIHENINRKNHKMCCLYYLSKDNKEYNEIFIEKYLETIEMSKLNEEKSNENLAMLFNVIEFDKTYLDSPLENLIYLYKLLKIFSNFETDFQNFIIYKYYRGYLKYRLGDLTQANKENLEIVSEIIDNEDSFMKYIKLLNDLLRVKIYHVTEKKSKADFNEYIQFLKTFFEEVKSLNKTLSLKIGFELFSIYIEGKEFNEGFGLLLQMKKMLKIILLNGVAMEYGIDYYLAIASRIGYMGIILNDKILILKAIKKIKKGLKMLAKENNSKTNELFKAYRFLSANLEIWLTQEIKYDMKSMASDFKETFLPDLKSNAYKNYIINENNKESIIMNFKIIDKTNLDFPYYSQNIKDKCKKDLNYNKNLTNTNFILLLSFYHDKIFINSEKYITNTNTVEKKDAAKEIIESFKQASLLINEYIDEPFLQIPFVKILVINIYSSYAYLLLQLKDFDKLKGIIFDMMDNAKSNLRSKLKINEKIPSYGLWLKIKGDYYLHLKHYDAAIESYKNAINILDKKHPKMPMILFNCGCAYYFNKDKNKALDYLNKSIVELSSIQPNNNYFGFVEDLETIKTKINVAKNLVEILSKQK